MVFVLYFNEGEVLGGGEYRGRRRLTCVDDRGRRGGMLK